MSDILLEHLDENDIEDFTDYLNYHGFESDDDDLYDDDNFEIEELYF